METLRDKIYSLLENNDKYVKLVDDKKQVNLFAIKKDIINMDRDLIRVLFNDNITKETFFIKIDNNYVFNKDKFIEVLNTRLLDDSYTKYKNKVGLIDENDSFISGSNEIVLSYPYKDCVLEGGQEKEVDNDGKKVKRKEVFYNPLVAEEETKLMMAPKVFVNAKRYTKDGVEESIESFNDDNLIIKGNNLLALSSILKRFEGRIKLIYIDPPFNTGNDSFSYNDSFSRSTWLTFMKNRLDVAKRLLKQDGSIFIHINENQSHYLKVLCDEIFKEENFMNEIIWRYRTYIGQVKDFFPKKHDTIYWYKKENRPKFNMSNVGNYEDTPDYKRWFSYLNENGEIIYGNHPTTDSRFDAYLRKYINQYGKPREGDVIYKNEGYVVDDVWEDIIALDAKNKSERIESFSGNGQKPEALLQRIITSVTAEGDLVLDFFGGSGTTMAVSHKLNRKYIGIEQMDYIDTVLVNRLLKVINGEKGGISDNVGWQGGGSFVYCELAKNNQQLIEDIENAKNSNDLDNILYRIDKSQYINVKVRIKDVIDSKKDFDELIFEEKQKFLIELLDKNQLYVNYDDIDDEEFNISESDRKFTKSFYDVED